MCYIFYYRVGDGIVLPFEAISLDEGKRRVLRTRLSPPFEEGRKLSRP